MLLYFVKSAKKIKEEKVKAVDLSHSAIQNLRKEKLSPHYMIKRMQSAGALLFAPLRAALTVEAAVALPVFLFMMIAAIQYGSVMEAAVKFGVSLSETGKWIATTAYVSRYGGNAAGVPELAVGALSTAYAQSQVMSQAGDTSSVKNTNMLLSSFLQKDEMIDLVLTYQICSPISIVKLPGNFFIQRARVRAWTGRTPPEKGSHGEGKRADESRVYVTVTGTVYHEDSNCTHLKLSVREVNASALGMLRNNNGGIYHKCDKCRGLAHGGRVYITKEGDKYHSSLSCSGLKRTVRQVPRNELGSLRPCSKCGKG